MYTTNKWKRFKRISLGIISGLLLCEVLLRIYNPLPAAVNKGKLILPANQQKIFSNSWIKKLDNKIYYSRNSLGFRGPELPNDKNNMISILTIGGSTTECKYLSDSCTWSARLYQKLHSSNNYIWLNNAGIDGHSTFGHTMLVKEYVIKFKPRYVIIMTGINDVELDAPDEFDRMTEKKVQRGFNKESLKSLINYSEVGKAFLNYYQLKVSFKKGLLHREIDFSKLVENPVPDSIVQLKLTKQVPFIKGYKQRLDSIINMCKAAGIIPILVTQPSMFGNYTDSLTQMTMGNKWMYKDAARDNCNLMEKVLELYNDVLRSYQPAIKVIDLASMMPKNSLYFYDFSHVTNAGAEKIAAILFEELKTSIR